MPELQRTPKLKTVGPTYFWGLASLAWGMVGAACACASGPVVPQQAQARQIVPNAAPESVHADHLPTAPKSHGAPAPKALSLCELSAAGAPAPEDAIAAYGSHLFIEEHGGGAVLRINSLPAEHAAVQARFDELGLRHFAFYPCDTHLVLWVPGYALCRQPGAYSDALRAKLPDFDIVECFVLDYQSIGNFCRNGRLPRQRCKARILANMTPEGCRHVLKEGNAELRDTIVALDMIDDVAAACNAPQLPPAP